MASYPRALATYQWGVEGVGSEGTPVAATSKIAIDEMIWTPDDENFRPSTLRGILARNQGNEEVVRRGANFTARGPVMYEQFQNWLAGLIVGGETPTGLGPFVWTYTHPLTSVPAVSTFTFERRLTDGTTPLDNEWAYGVINRVRLSAAAGEPWQMEAEGFARRIQSSTLTPALTVPTSGIPVAGLTELYIDDTWGNLGTTKVASQVLSFELEIMNGFQPQYTLDGLTDLDFGTHVLNSDNGVAINASITCLVGPQLGLERTAAQANDLRAVRLEVNGDATEKILIDFLAKHVRPDVYEVGIQDGFYIVTFELQESHDGTNQLEVELTNDVGAFV